MFKSVHKFLIKFTKKYKFWIAAFIIIDIILMLMNSVLTQSTIRNLINTINREDGNLLRELKESIYTLVIYNLIFICGDILIKYIYPNLFSKIRNNIYCYVFNHIEKYSYSYFQNNFSGNIGAKVSKIADTSEKFLYNFFDVIICKGILKVITLYYIYKIHIVLFLVDIIWMVLYVTITTFINVRIRSKVELFENEKTMLSGRITDSFDNILNVKSFSNKKYEQSLIKQQTKLVYSKEKELYKNKILYESLRTLLSSPLLLINIILSVKLHGGGLITIGDISFVVTMSYSIVKSIKYFNEEISAMVDQYGIIKQSLDIMNKPLEVLNMKDASTLKISNGKIEIKDISFEYEEDKNVLSHFSLSIQPNQKLGIVGYSGSGKSTLVNLLLRFYDVNDGGIYIDNQNIKEVTQESLRRNISYIPQEPILFHRTIRENILYGKLDATEEELIEATKKACCYDFITNTLENGFNTLVGERGIKLSGGQRQRIAIARAILKNSKILILDEATSALDSITEKEIQIALNNLMKDKTVIVIAHRLSTLSIMDRIVTISKGIIVEDGTKEELLNKEDGLFRQMWDMQREGVIGEIK